MNEFNEANKESINVKLTLLTVDALGKYLEWSKDKEAVDFIGGGKELSSDDIKNRFQEIFQSGNNAYWSILVNGVNVGHISLHNIDHVTRTAVVGILIGDKNARSQGVGAKVLALVEEKARELKIKKMIAEINNTNIKSIRLVESARFSFVRELPEVGARLYEKEIN